MTAVCRLIAQNSEVFRRQHVLCYAITDGVAAQLDQFVLNGFGNVRGVLGSSVQVTLQNSVSNVDAKRLRGADWFADISPSVITMTAEGNAQPAA